LLHCDNSNKTIGNNQNPPPEFFLYKMAAKCGSQGPMICLHGSECNETTGFCGSCPVGFRDDNVLFIGNHNCGVEDASMYAIYIIASICAITVGTRALFVALKRKQNRMTKVLYLDVIWNFLIPFYSLSHYLNGMTYGPSSVVFLIVILMLVNTQVVVYMHSVEHFMGLLCNVSSPQRVYLFMKRWYIFWMLNKLMCGIPMLIGSITGSVDLFNIAQLVLTCSLFIEVSSNVGRQYYTNTKLVKAAHVLHKDIHVNSADSGANPIVMDFAKKVKAAKFIIPIYGMVFVTAAISIPVLFAIYGGAIPHIYVCFGVTLITWPMVGIRPIMILRTRLGQHMDKSKTETTATTGRRKVSVKSSSHTQGNDAVVVSPSSERDNSTSFSPVTGTKKEIAT
jgi:hypothetical protein